MEYVDNDKKSCLALIKYSNASSSNRFTAHVEQQTLKTMDRNTAMDLLDWAHRSQNIEDGSDSWFETCGKGSLEYYECVGDYTTVWKRGYSTLFDILMVLVCHLNLLSLRPFNLSVESIEKHS